MEEQAFDAGDVIITDRLSERLARAPDYAAENRALEGLAAELAERPGNLLQRLAETIVDLGLGDSAGVSIEETTERRQFRWVALAGVWRHLRGSTIPFDASPCGLAVRRNELLLIESPERFFAEAQVEPLICEGLLLPFRVDGKPVGTLWVNAHNPRRKFDAEDARFLKSLARFASAGFRTVQALEAAQAGKDELEQRVAAQLAELEASEEKYRTLFENMGQGYALGEVIRDKDGRAIDLRYLELNPAFERLSGIPVAQAQGRTVLEVYGTVEPEWFDVAERVARLKVPERVEYEIGAIGRWFQMHFYPAEGDRYLGLYEDVTDRKRAEAALRESEERQAFLLKLSDALRPLTDALAIQETATRLLGEHLDARAVNYGLVEAVDGVNYYVIDRAYVAPGRRSTLGRWPITDFPGFTVAMRAGETMAVDDVASDPNLLPKDKAGLALTDTAAFLMAPLVKNGRPTAMLCIVEDKPRKWTSADIALVQDVAERTWAAVERARSEAALRESEERFQQFATASAAGLWIRDARTLDMEFTSPAVGTIYGVEPDALLGDVKKWASMIVPEDRAGALEHLEAARQGTTAMHEFRIQRPSDTAFRWIRNTDFPLHDNGDVGRVGGIVEDITETRQLVDHQGVLLAELQHRVRNIMGMIRSMANRTAPGAKDIEDYRSLLEGRLLALARVQALLTRQANAGASLRSIVEEEVAAQAHHGGQFKLDGPDIMLAPKAVEVLTLAFHELATNALKYGALSIPEGRLTVSWAPFEKRGRQWLGVDWVETGAPARAPSTRKGFGSELIEARIPYELGGTGTITIAPEGARCRMEFALKEAESILETDAPLLATVFGGTLDMTGAADLTGRTVLVVEDDYYMARDTTAALGGAGADVLGPCPSEDATLDLLDAKTPTHAVLDLNLGGGGPKFAIAEELKRRGVPFIFLTGYDPDVIPAELADVPRLQKPVPFRSIVEAVARLDSKS